MSVEKYDWRKHPELEPSLVQDTRGRLRGIADPERRLEVALVMKEAMRDEVIRALEETTKNSLREDDGVARERGLRIEEN